MPDPNTATDIPESKLKLADAVLRGETVSGGLLSDLTWGELETVARDLAGVVVAAAG